MIRFAVMKPLAFTTERSVMQHVEITGSDDRMDCHDTWGDPINALPRKCDKCGFPDLDFVPQPYLLVKSRTMTPNELALAHCGNLLVRDRVRQVLELLAPAQCNYYPTCYKGTLERTPWFLAVPTHQVVNAKVAASIPRCESCNEPRSAHPGTQWVEYLFGIPRRNQPLGESWKRESEYDILKSATWGSSERGWDRWIDRGLFLSVRLLHLLKKIKAKGIDEATCQKPLAPDQDESTWIKEQLRTIEASGIPLHAEGTVSEADARWFRDYLKAHAPQVVPDWDIKSVERRIKAKLPKSFVDFVNTVGLASFENIDEQVGFSACIRSPSDLAFEDYANDFDDDESKAVNGLPFATTEHGDCFCFDVQKGKKEYAVFLYKHECNLLEPYAENFAACIKRFAGE